MDFIKRHFFLLLFILLMIGALIFKVPGLFVLLGVLLYLLLVLLIRLPKTIFWIGYFLKTSFHKDNASFRFLERGYKMGARSTAPMILYAMELLKKCRYQEGRILLEEVVTAPKVNPTLLKVARQDLGIAYYKCGDLATAINTLEQMRKDYDILNPDLNTTLAYLYIEKGDLLTAEEINDDALKEDESFGGAYDNLGMIRYLQGDLVEARAMFEKALELKESLASSMYYLGLIAEEVGDDDLARQYFTAAHNAKLTGLNTVTKEMIEAKYSAHMN